MNGMGEAAADLAEGALLARTVEPAAGEAADGHTHESACLNCGTALVGSHCHACGQAAHVHKTIGAFFHDLLHGVFHFEGKIWRTLPMLAWRPGRLTREYIDGRRASYVSPIALFLFSVFLLFAVIKQAVPPVDANVNQGIGQAIASERAQLFELEKKRQGADAGEIAEIDKALAEGRANLSALETLKANGLDAAQVSAQADKAVSDVPWINEALARVKANPDLALYKLQTYAYKYSWALIPISVPFLWLLYPFSRRFGTYDHTVFVTYSLCFMTLLVVLVIGVGILGAPQAAVLLFVIPPLHMYRQLRGTYGSSRIGALLRTWALACFAFFALLLFTLFLAYETGA
jgi:hypothetical protein